MRSLYNHTPEQCNHRSLPCHGATTIGQACAIQARVGYWLDSTVRESLTSGLHHAPFIIERMNKQQQSVDDTNSAFIDAVGGVVATVVTVWSFYPLDLWKTKLQAGGNGSSSLTLPAEQEQENEPNVPSKETQIVQSLFKGVGAKSLHSIGSSFCYFYIYSWIVARHRRRRKNDQDNRHHVSPGTGLLLSALAAAANTFITLPLDVISTRRQMHSPDAARHIGHSPSICARIRRAKSLWRGLLPSLILCSNPAINFTVYDVIKSIRLRKKVTDGDTLSMLEAFLLGLIAKFVATITTYPLIRAKVCIMASNDLSLCSCLKDHYRKGGVHELYRGCNLQLLHTVLKSALMMMIRERISLSTRRWLRAVKQS